VAGQVLRGRFSVESAVPFRATFRRVHVLVEDVTEFSDGLAKLSLTALVENATIYPSVSPRINDLGSHTAQYRDESPHDLSILESEMEPVESHRLFDRKFKVAIASDLLLYVLQVRTEGPTGDHPCPLRFIPDGDRWHQNPILTIRA